MTRLALVKGVETFVQLANTLGRALRHPNERRLVDISQQEHVDLVVLSAHGVACDPARAFGSVTAHLLTHSVVPLLVLQDLPNELERPADVGAQAAPPLRASFPPEAV